MMTDHNQLIEKAVEAIQYENPHSLTDLLRDLLREATTVPCPECEGDGLEGEGPLGIVDPETGEGHPCPTCSGTGRISERCAEGLELAEFAKRVWVDGSAIKAKLRAEVLRREEERRGSD